jgi:hypothetical protein
MRAIQGDQSFKELMMNSLNVLEVAGMRLTLRDDPALGACVVGISGDWPVRDKMEVAFDRQSEPVSNLHDLSEADPAEDRKGIAIVG